MPDPKGPYMRGSIADFMPDPLTPLFATMGVPAINAGMKRTMAETIGGSLAALDNYFTTINGYAYLHVSLGCRDWIWVLFRWCPPFRGSCAMASGTGERWQSPLRRVMARWRDRPPHDAEAGPNCCAGRGTGRRDGRLSHLAPGGCHRHRCRYRRAVHCDLRQDHQAGGRSACRNPAVGRGQHAHPGRKGALRPGPMVPRARRPGGVPAGAPSRQLADQLDGDVPPGADVGDWLEWQRRFGDYLTEFGHSIYDLDFAKPLPVNDPLPLLEVLKMFIRGEGKDPHARQQESVARREEAVQTAMSRVKGLKRRLFGWSLRLAQTFACVREDSIFDIGMGYPVLRRMLRELGRRLVKAGAIAEADDIYF